MRRIRFLNAVFAAVVAPLLAGPARADAPGGPDAPAPVAPAAAPAEERAGWTVAESRGRALARPPGEGARPRGRLAKGARIADGETVLSGPGARLELRGADGARWRLGQHAVWSPSGPGAARLLAGSALATVPAGAVLRLASARAEVELGPGVWLATAVENGGLKLTALENGRAALPAGAGEAGAPEAKGRALKLAAGEVVFAPPGGTDFGPVVTIYLEELLATSRLVSGFDEPLPQMRRLLALAEAQRERIGAMTHAFVGGARDGAGFQVIAPKPGPGR